MGPNPDRQSPPGREFRRHRVRGLVAALLLGVLPFAPPPLQAAEPSRADQRSITVESTLKDLSRANDAALRDGHLTVLPGKDISGRPRTELVADPPPEAAVVVQGEVQSSLHRLRRETAQHQTADGRKARVNDTRDRNAEDAAADR